MLDTTIVRYRMIFQIVVVAASWGFSGAPDQKSPVMGAEWVGKIVGRWILSRLGVGYQDTRMVGTSTERPCHGARIIFLDMVSLDWPCRLPKQLDAFQHGEGDC